MSAVTLAAEDDVRAWHRRRRTERAAATLAGPLGAVMCVSSRPDLPWALAGVALFGLVVVVGAARATDPKALDESRVDLALRLHAPVPGTNGVWAAEVAARRVRWAWTGRLALACLVALVLFLALHTLTTDGLAPVAVRAAAIAVLVALTVHQAAEHRRRLRDARHWLAAPPA